MSSEVVNLGPQPGVSNTGVYPSLGAPLQAATAQMSDAEAASMGANLKKLSDARKAGAVSEAEYQQRLAELQKLAKTTAPPQTPKN